MSSSEFAVSLLNIRNDLLVPCLLSLCWSETDVASLHVATSFQLNSVVEAKNLSHYALEDTIRVKLLADSIEAREVLSPISLGDPFSSRP
jgi:hypothetical protein